MRATTAMTMVVSARRFSRAADSTASISNLPISVILQPRLSAPK
nr:MAG TPA: hypothetical protein [Caudoviricetes sp.]